MTVLFDADCELCRWIVARVLRWDRAGRVRAAAIQGEQGGRLLAQLPMDQRLASWHAVDAAGRCASGGAAFAPLLRELPGGAAPARLAERFPRATGAAYRLVTRHRGRLRRLLSDRAIVRADAEIERRRESSGHVD